MSEPRIEDRVRSLFGRLADLPDADAAIETSGHHELAVRAEGNGVLIFGRLRERVQSLSRRHIPQLDGAIPAGRREQLAVRREGQSVNGVVVTGKRLP